MMTEVVLGDLVLAFFRQHPLSIQCENEACPATTITQPWVPTDI